MVILTYRGMEAQWTDLFRGWNDLELFFVESLVISCDVQFCLLGFYLEGVQVA